MKFRLFIGLLVSLCIIAGLGHGPSAKLVSAGFHPAKTFKLIDKGNRRHGQRLVDTALGDLRMIYALWAFAACVFEHKTARQSEIRKVSYLIPVRPRYIQHSSLLI